jgi:hypothetical protein
MDSKQHRLLQAQIAHKVPQPTFTPKPKRQMVRRCCKCKRVLTGYDVNLYRKNSNGADPYGFPEVCEDCAESEVRP